MKPRLAAALAACLLLPVAAASATYETEGRLRMPRVEVRGSVDLHGAGLLEVEVGPSGGDAGLQVDFAGLARGVLVDRTRDKVHAGLPHAHEPSVTSPESTEDAIAVEGAGRVENVRCGTQCLVALVAEPGEGVLGARGSVDGTLTPTARERVFSTARSPQGYASQLRYVVPAGSVEVEPGRLGDATPWVSGRVVLVLVDATFDLVADGTRTTLDARWWNETTQEAAGRPVTVRHHARHAVLVLDGPALDLAPGARSRLSFPDGVDARLEGTLVSPDASGALTVAGTRHELDHDSVLLEGALAARLGGSPPALVTGAAGFDLEVRGEATRVVVSGASLLPRIPPAAAEAGGGLLALLGVTLLGRLVVAPLYHRLGPSDVLANPNRLRIYEAVRERPGVDVGALVASLGISRVLVRHHLRMLEAHRLVRATAWRRRRTYALAGEGAGLAACELKDATRRRLAAALVRAGRATQKDLVASLGLSQRLVSYHLSRLEGASLVRTEGKNPRVYVATEALVRALEKEEGAVAAAVATTA